MKILGIRTDSPVTGLFVLSDTDVVADLSIETDRELSSKLPSLVQGILSDNALELADLGGLVCFAGPGSFTGLRIGHSYANALAYALSIPIVQRSGEAWLAEGAGALLAGENDKVVIPEYGAEANITKPKSI
jgi:tRNA threonylcarbamoyladenosine biosynthesis protein TsaB